jgi:hypothetical protein
MKQDHRAGNHLRSNDRHDKRGSVETAGQLEIRSVGGITIIAESKAILAIAGRILASRSTAQRRVDVARAAVDAITGQDRNGNHATGEEEIQHDGKEGEDADTAEAAGQNDSKDHVEHGSAAQALDGLLPCCDRQITVRQDGQEVRVDTKDDTAGTENYGIENSLKELQKRIAEGRHFDGWGS